MPMVEISEACALEWVLSRHHGRCACIQLAPLFNGVATSSDGRRGNGNFSYISRCTYPAEELPDANQIITLRDIPFLFPDTADGHSNNIETEEQLILLPDPSVSMMAILGACDTTKFREGIEVRSAVETAAYPFGLSSWVDEHPDYDNILAWRGTHVHDAHRDLTSFKPALWIAQIFLRQRQAIRSLQLPYNPSLHIFAITLLNENMHVPPNRGDTT